MNEQNRDEMDDIMRINNLEAKKNENRSESMEVVDAEPIDLKEMNMDWEMYRNIDAVLNIMVRPKLAEDGGNLELSYLDEEGVLWIRMLGGCAGCPSADETVKNLVEHEVVSRIPEIKAVEIDDGLDYDFIQNALNTMLTNRTKK